MKDEISVKSAKKLLWEAEKLALDKFDLSLTPPPYEIIAMFADSDNQSFLLERHLKKIRAFQQTPEYKHEFVVSLLYLGTKENYSSTALENALKNVKVNKICNIDNNFRYEDVHLNKAKLEYDQDINKLKGKKSVNEKNINLGNIVAASGGVVMIAGAVTMGVGTAVGSVITATGTVYTLWYSGSNYFFVNPKLEKESLINAKFDEQMLNVCRDVIKTQQAEDINALKVNAANAIINSDQNMSPLEGYVTASTIIDQMKTYIDDNGVVILASDEELNNLISQNPEENEKTRTEIKHIAEKLKTASKPLKDQFEEDSALKEDVLKKMEERLSGEIKNLWKQALDKELVAERSRQNRKAVENTGSVVSGIFQLMGKDTVAREIEECTQVTLTASEAIDGVKLIHQSGGLIKALQSAGSEGSPFVNLASVINPVMALARVGIFVFNKILFKNKGPSIEEVTLKLLQQMFEYIQEFRAQMNYRFDAVELKMLHYYLDLSSKIGDIHADTQQIIRASEEIDHLNRARINIIDQNLIQTSGFKEKLDYAQMKWIEYDHHKEHNRQNYFAMGDLTYEKFLDHCQQWMNLATYDISVGQSKLTTENFRVFGYPGDDFKPAEFFIKGLFNYYCQKGNWGETSLAAYIAERGGYDRIDVPNPAIFSEALEWYLKWTHAVPRSIPLEKTKVYLIKEKIAPYRHFHRALVDDLEFFTQLIDDVKLQFGKMHEIVRNAEEEVKSRIRENYRMRQENRFQKVNELPNEISYMSQTRQEDWAPKKKKHHHRHEFQNHKATYGEIKIFFRGKLIDDFSQFSDSSISLLQGDVENWQFNHINALVWPESGNKGNIAKLVPIPLDQAYIRNQKFSLLMLVADYLNAGQVEYRYQNERLRQGAEYQNYCHRGDEHDAGHNHWEDGSDVACNVMDFIVNSYYQSPNLESYLLISSVCRQDIWQERREIRMINQKVYRFKNPLSASFLPQNLPTDPMAYHETVPDTESMKQVLMTSINETIAQRRKDIQQEFLTAVATAGADAAVFSEIEFPINLLKGFLDIAFPTQRRLWQAFEFLKPSHEFKNELGIQIKQGTIFEYLSNINNELDILKAIIENFSDICAHMEDCFLQYPNLAENISELERVEKLLEEKFTDDFQYIPNYDNESDEIQQTEIAARTDRFISVLIRSPEMQESIKRNPDKAQELANLLKNLPIVTQIALSGSGSKLFSSLLSQSKAVPSLPNMQTEPEQQSTEKESVSTCDVQDYDANGGKSELKSEQEASTKNEPIKPPSPMPFFSGAEGHVIRSEDEFIQTSSASRLSNPILPLLMIGTVFSSDSNHQDQQNNQDPIHQTLPDYQSNFNEQLMLFQWGCQYLSSWMPWNQESPLAIDDIDTLHENKTKLEALYDDLADIRSGIIADTHLFDDKLNWLNKAIREINQKINSALKKESITQNKLDEINTKITKIEKMLANLAIKEEELLNMEEQSRALAAEGKRFAITYNCVQDLLKFKIEEIEPEKDILAMNIRLGDTVLLDQIGAMKDQVSKMAQSDKATEELMPAFQGLLSHSVPKDGNCLFHAVGLYLELEADYLRKIVASHMEANKEDLRQFYLGTEEDFERHIEMIRNCNEWGGNLEIVVLQRLLDRPIIILRPDARPIIPDNLGELHGEPIFVNYNGHNHYDALILKKGFEAKKILEEIIIAMDQNHGVDDYSLEQTDQYFSKRKGPLGSIWDSEKHTSLSFWKSSQSRLFGQQQQFWSSVTIQVVIPEELSIQPKEVRKLTI